MSAEVRAARWVAKDAESVMPSKVPAAVTLKSNAMSGAGEKATSGNFGLRSLGQTPGSYALRRWA